RQAENANESRRIFLIVAVAHGERREIGAVERMFRLATEHRDIPLVERKRDAARHFLLGAFDESIEGLAQRREPQAEVNQFGVFQADVLLEMGDVSLQTESFQFTM